MTQDEIIEMAKLVVGNYEHAQYWPFFTEELEHFAKLVADVATTKEREACAKFIEDGYARQFENPWREDLAAAIRARGETTLRGEA